MRSCYLVFSLLIISCATKTNQYIQISKDIKKRNGLWIEEYCDKDSKYISKVRYSKGERVGVWRTYLDGRLQQKDITRGQIIKTKIYYPDVRIWQKGQSKLDISPLHRHWYYFGDWKFYDDSGRLRYIKKYIFGRKTDSIAVH